MRGVDQAAQHGLFLDDARVVLDVGDVRHAVRERGEIGSAAGGFQFAAAVQFFGERDEVDGLLGFAESDHVRENVAVMREKKSSGLSVSTAALRALIVEQDGAEDATLSV